MKKEAFMVQPGRILSAEVSDADGKVETFWFKVRAPGEIADFFAKLGALGEETTPENTKSRLALYAKFISDSLCEEDGSRLMTEQECAMIPAGLRIDLRDLITARSSEVVAKLGKT